MRVVGLTGGMGSGKSTFAREFEKIGVPIFIADQESKKILDQDPVAIEKVSQLLGASSYTVNEKGSKTADKSHIADRVFKNQELLEKLNAILHPLVRNGFKEWVSRQTSNYVIYEAAILFESGSHQLCDETILIWSSKEERIQRVMARDHSDRKAIEQRLAHQWSEIKKLKLSKFVIVNDKMETISSKVKTFDEIMLKSK